MNWKPIPPKNIAFFMQNSLYSVFWMLILPTLPLPQAVCVLIERVIHYKNSLHPAVLILVVACIILFTPIPPVLLQSHTGLLVI